ncbi:DUF805 domain-containing protein [Sediminicola sp. 1XM1-17]|uniref:DUF805 domain-containing protein n=1 Tax=Sediminicola sp. 1XM1-17 TaxID=3127702 RepID=UPI0030785F78
MFKDPFSFEGRIRRTEYGLSYLIYMIFYFFVMTILQLRGKYALLIFALCNIPLLWFMWAQGAKRCHDLGYSGWYQLIPFFNLWLLYAKGKPGSNEYGDHPKNPEANTSLDYQDSSLK